MTDVWQHDSDTGHSESEWMNAQVKIQEYVFFFFQHCFFSILNSSLIRGHLDLSKYTAPWEVPSWIIVSSHKSWILNKYSWWCTNMKQLVLLFLAWKLKYRTWGSKAALPSWTDAARAGSASRAYMHVMWNFVDEYWGQARISTCPSSTEVDPSRVVAGPFCLGGTSFSLSDAFSFLFFFKLGHLLVKPENIAWNHARANLVVLAKLHGWRAVLNSNCSFARCFCLLRHLIL